MRVFITNSSHQRDDLQGQRCFSLAPHFQKERNVYMRKKKRKYLRNKVLRLEMKKEFKKDNGDVKEMFFLGGLEELH